MCAHFGEVNCEYAEAESSFIRYESESFHHEMSMCFQWPCVTHTHNAGDFHTKNNVEIKSFHNGLALFRTSAYIWVSWISYQVIRCCSTQQTIKTEMHWKITNPLNDSQLKRASNNGNLRWFSFVPTFWSAWKSALQLPTTSNAKSRLL